MSYEPAVIEETQARPAKRTRLSRACDRCRQRKIRCDEQQPRCGPCHHAQYEECVTTHPKRAGLAPPERRRAGQQQRSEESILGTTSTLTSRMDRMESMLERLINGIAQSSQAANNSHRSELGKSIATEGLRRGPSPSVPALEDSVQSIEEDNQRWDNNRQNDEAEWPRMFNDQSSVMAFTRTTQAFEEVTGDLNFPRDGQRTSDSIADMKLPDPGSLTWPSSPIMHDLLHLYFRYHHQFFPITPRSVLLSLWSSHKNRHSHAEIMQLSIALAIGASRRALAELESCLFDQAWSMIGGTIAQPSLSGIRALTMAIILLLLKQKPGLAWSLTGTAIRMAQGCGLHRQASKVRDDFLWWVLYCLDRCLAFVCGRPFAFIEQNSDISPLPDTDTWSSLVKLAQILSVLRTEVFETNLSGRNTNGEAINLVAKFDAKLRQWAMAVEGVSGNGLLRTPSVRGGPEILMAFAYHHAMMMLHSVGLFVDVTSSRMSALGFGATPCVESARAILRIFEILLQIPFDRRPPISLAYPLAGTWIIAIRLLVGPTGPNTPDDFKMLTTGCEGCVQEYGRYGYTDYLKQFPLIVKLVSQRLPQSEQPLHNSPNPDMNGSRRQAQLNTNQVPPPASDSSLSLELDDNLWQMFTQQASSLLPWSFDTDQIAEGIFPLSFAAASSSWFQEPGDELQRNMP